MHGRFTIVALAIAATVSPLALAEPSQAAAQCLALVQQEKIAEAEPVCAKAAEEPGKQGKLNYADLLSRKGDFKGAIAKYSEILSGVDLAKPTQTEFEALEHRTLIGFYVGDTYADDDARAVLALLPNDVAILETGAQRSSSPLQKLEYADKLVALDAKIVEYHVLRSFALNEMDRSNEALAAAETALKLDSRSAVALTARGFAHGKLGELVKAEKDHAAAARNLPEDPTPLVNRADVLVILKRYDDAIELANKALGMDPGNHRALFVRANAHLFMGHGEAALDDLDKVNSPEMAFTLGSLKYSAEIMIDAQKALTAESIEAMEQDRAIVVSGIEAHMHDTCGYYSVPGNPDNDTLNAYRDCLTEWYKVEHDGELRDAVGAEVLAAAERLNSTATRIAAGDGLVCSKMPKKSRCVDDKLYARAQESLKYFDDPKAIVGDAEFARLNREIDSYNAQVKRANGLINTANFLDAVANALGSQ